MTLAKVVVVAPRGDVHGDVVFDALQDARANPVRLDTHALLGSKVSWTPGGPATISGQDDVLVDHRTSVWWRRPGFADPQLPDPDETALVLDEAAAILPGVLEASGVRWVDPPWHMNRARLKPFQLAVASRLGCVVPDTTVTGDPTSARRFAAGRTVVAKAVSSGVGIAPHVATVTADDVGHVDVCPTLLQEAVDADADLRVVTVDGQAFAWARRRDCASLDWRHVDPQGAGFEPTDGVPDHAVRLTDALGLSFSVQDWLVTDSGPVFLEVNVSGQWLFLSGSEDRVVPALVDHLLSDA